jgi:hypothetical protein
MFRKGFEKVITLLPEATGEKPRMKLLVGIFCVLNEGLYIDLFL